MQLDEALAKRRSIRRYRSDPVSAEAIEKIIQAAYSAPSGANASPWLYVDVTDPSVKEQIRAESEAVDKTWDADMPAWFRSWLANQEISESKRFLEDAPHLLVVFSDIRMPYAVESTWISIGYALLAATQEGLGTLTYTPGKPGFLTRILRTEDHWMPQAILPIGFPAESPDPAGRPKICVLKSGREYVEGVLETCPGGPMKR